MTEPLDRMLELARFLFVNNELELLSDVLHMAVGKAPNDPRSIELLVKHLANQEKQDGATAAAAAWMARNGPRASLLYLLSRSLASFDEEHAVACGTWTIVLAPEHHLAYEHLAALLDRRSDKHPVARLLYWLSVWFTTDDPRSGILLHKSFQISRSFFEERAITLSRSVSGIFWGAYYRAMIDLLQDGIYPNQYYIDTLVKETAPRFRLESVKTMAEWVRQPVPVFEKRRDLFEFCLGLLAQTPLGERGQYIECGVYHGGSAHTIARFIDKTLHAFDSLQGLPHNWENEPKGSYSTYGKIPLLPENVEFHAGWFSDTLPEFRMHNNGPIAFVHVDCDLYSSTRDVFNAVGDLMVRGTIIIFDEYFGYQGFEGHEMLAFNEYLATADRQATVIAAGPFTKQLAFRLEN